MKNNTAQATKVITAYVPLLMADKVDQMAARLERSRLDYQQVLSARIAQEEQESPDAGSTGRCDIRTGHPRSGLHRLRTASILTNRYWCLADGTEVDQQGAF